MTTYRDEKGSNLTPAEVDANFRELRADLDDVIANPPTANSIESITLSGFNYTFHLTDGTPLGPVPAPVVQLTWRGQWQPFTLYSELDKFFEPGLGEFTVLQDHTSAATFDPDAVAGSPLAPLYLQTSGVGSNTNFADLADVTITSVADNDFIAWAAGSSAWTNRTTAQVAALIGPLIELDDLADVDAPTPSLGQVLTWTGSPASWQPATPATPASALDDLSDVSVPAPDDGDVLTYQAGSPTGWVASPPAAVPTTLDALSDVAVPTPADGDFLQYESGSPAGWRNQAGTAVSSLGDATLPVNTASLLAISEALGSPPTYDTKKITIAGLLAAGNITLGSTAVALGSTVTTIAGLTLTAPNIGAATGTSLSVSGQVSGATIGIGADVVLARSGAFILSQRNGASAQVFRIYNTFTDSSNGEWATFDWGLAANALSIGTRANGAGVGRDVRLITDGIAGLRMDASQLIAIGPSVTMTSAFPALKRSATAIVHRLADDSGFAESAAGEYQQFGGLNGQHCDIKSKTEETVIAAAAFTDTTITIPAGARVLFATTRVTTVIPTASTFDVGISGATTRFGAGISTAATTTDIGNDGSTNDVYAAATAIRITPNLTPAANTGRVRVTVHYWQVTPPTS